MPVVSLFLTVRCNFTEKIFIMPNATSIQSISQGRLIQIVDTPRTATDLFKLPVAFRTQFDASLKTLEDADNDTALTESNRAGGSGAARTALDQLEVLLRDGYNGIKGIRSSTITDDQRLEVYTTYGWTSGNLGTFNDARVLGLARLCLADDLEIENPAWEVAADLKAEIAAQLAIFDANADDRTGGERMLATKARDKALKEFDIYLARVRFYLCFASMDTDQSPELRRYGFKVRKDRAASTPAPAAVVPPVNP